MDANSQPVRPDRGGKNGGEENGLRQLLLDAPILPFAAAAFVGTCCGYHAADEPSPPWIACLAVVGLAALLPPRARRTGALGLLVALGLVVGSRGRPPDLSAVDPDLPVVLEGRVASYPRGTPGEEWLWLRVDRVTQRDAGRDGGFDVLVGLPDAERPSDTEIPAWGQRVRLKGYLRTSPAPGNNDVPTRPGPWRLNLPSWRFWDVASRPPAWQRLATEVRTRVDERLSSPADPSLGRRLRRALLLGSPDDLPDPLRRRLRAAGLSHVLAVSGLHVGLLAGWMWLAALPCGRRVRLLLALVGIAAYLLLVGPKASALRAAGMACIVAAALILRRPPQALNAAALWSTLLVLWEPQVLDDLGFRLSVGATLGILTLGPAASRSLEGAARSCGLSGRGVQLVCRGLGASLAAQIATMPLLTPWTGLVHPGSPWLNLLAIPWLTVFLGLSFVSAACLGTLDWLLVPWLDLLALPLRWLAETPPSVWTTLPASVSVGQCVVVSATLVALLLRPWTTVRVTLMVVLPGLSGGSAEAPTSPQPLELVRLDVGQGDALLLRNGEHTLLVDGGGWRRGDVAARVLVPALAQFGVRHLDAVALTHPDTDHCRGLVDLASYLSLGEVWMSPGWTDPCATDLLASSGAPWRTVLRGDRMDVGRWGVEVLWPPPGMRRGEANTRSLVLRVSGGRHRLLLAADATAAVERRLLRLERDGPGGDSLRSTILGVGHHGSKTSTSRSFLHRVSPVLATVGVGARNSYGHPHPSVVERLERSGVRIHRTDRMGALHLRLDPRDGDPRDGDPET